ncbi:hypothetical protein SNEBB_003615 [Seison nebaliae]|nr:hypothetical protein SNEBB_003615 [Seison nebaliae]
MVKQYPTFDETLGVPTPRPNWLSLVPASPYAVLFGYILLVAGLGISFICHTLLIYTITNSIRLYFQTNVHFNYLIIPYTILSIGTGYIGTKAMLSAQNLTANASSISTRDLGLLLGKTRKNCINTITFYIVWCFMAIYSCCVLLPHMICSRLLVLSLTPWRLQYFGIRTEYGPHFKGIGNEIFFDALSVNYNLAKAFVICTFLVIYGLLLIGSSLSALRASGEVYIEMNELYERRKIIENNLTPKKPLIKKMIPDIAEHAGIDEDGWYTL